MNGENKLEIAAAFFYHYCLEGGKHHRVEIVAFSGASGIKSKNHTYHTVLKGLEKSSNLMEMLYLAKFNVPLPSGAPF